MTGTSISFILNGERVTATVEGSQRLIDILRGPMGLTGPKEACGDGECGACTVLLDGRPVCSCIYPAVEVEGRRVTTIEGLAAAGGRLSVLQDAFVQAGAIQCGFCTPGMIMSAHALLSSSPDPSEEEIREALAGNLCRCTGYVQIVKAVRLAARRMAGGEEAS